MRVDTLGMATTFPARAEEQFALVKKPATGQQPQSQMPVQEAPKAAVLDGKKLEEALEITNQALGCTQHHLQFKLHEASGRYQVRVVDENQQVIREIPPEKMLELSAGIKEMLDNMMGVFFDELA